MGRGEVKSILHGGSRWLVTNTMAGIEPAMVFKGER
jgi:hypothetical protein